MKIKIRVWDEKYNQWDYDPLLIYPENDYLKQGRVTQVFIGIKDVGGIDIYEGDIISYIEKMDEHGDAQVLTATVRYDEGTASFMLNDWNYFSDRTISNFKIVGNIFEAKNK